MPQKCHLQEAYGYLAAKSFAAKLKLFHLCSLWLPRRRFISNNTSQCAWTLSLDQLLSQHWAACLPMIFILNFGFVFCFPKTILVDALSGKLSCDFEELIGLFFLTPLRSNWDFSCWADEDYIGRISRLSHWVALYIPMGVSKKLWGCTNNNLYIAHEVGVRIPRSWETRPTWRSRHDHIHVRTCTCARKGREGGNGVQYKLCQ